ncbi:protein-tyrosine phosphatase-like protein [Mycotypha africana]|uniref:protein-tyrosine phosphatase-like protein n=1 Tax=Mycotypha africana TaxID=64632 RepID=UPI002300FCF2|nr:protein-tyrosine phosphatase-like protein [Mycotypha africana]KAI8973374.1 protein-tyrosine phosphatase-like protein [Mycotypha africana]
MGRPVSLIETNKLDRNNKKHQHPNIRFLLLDCPTTSNLPFYLEEFNRYNVSLVIRCQQFNNDDSKNSKYNYDITPLVDQDIQVHDLPFKDGGIPPPSIIQKWLTILNSICTEQVQSNKQQDGEQPVPISTPTIAVHCMAGLGRAPVLVAIALIELFHMEPLDTVEFIRNRRKGAFNSAQISFLDYYKPSLRNNNVFGLCVNGSHNGNISHNSINNGHKLSPTLNYLMNYFTSIFGNKHPTTITTAAADKSPDDQAHKQQNSAATTTFTPCIG